MYVKFNISAVSIFRKDDLLLLDHFFHSILILLLLSVPTVYVGSSSDVTVVILSPI